MEYPIDALAANPVGVGKVTAGLSVAAPTDALAAAPVGVGKVTAALSVKNNLAANPIGTGGVTGVLSVTSASGSFTVAGKGVELIGTFSTFQEGVDAANTWARANRSFRTYVTDSTGTPVYICFVRPEPPED